MLGSGSGYLELGSTTLTPLCNIGVITMKMISRTSITSTIGVTFISATNPPSPLPVCIPIVLPHFALLDEVVDQLARRVIHLDGERLNLVREDVERPDGGNGDQKTESGLNQRLRDSAGDRGYTGSFGCLHSLECADNADNGSQQAHEGRSRTDSSQSGKAPAQFGGL